MKKTLLLLTLFTIGTFFAQAQSDRYVGAMKKALAGMDSAFASPDGLRKAAAQFERIALAEKSVWLPYYYASFMHVNLAFQTKDVSAVDAIADKAEALIRVADSLQPKHSEISCLKSMIASARMMVNPMKRWQEFGPVSGRHLDEAIAQDPTNPRPHYLRGQSLLYTPENFGGGCKTAKPELEQAKTKFASFVVASELHPNWGLPIVEKLLKTCDK